MKSLFKKFCIKPSEPRFVRCCDFSSVLEPLLYNANSFIILVSPYIRLNSRIIDIFKIKRENNIDLTIICRENFADSYLATSLYIRKNLHAKCYITENAFLLGSMNLYDYSTTHNDEFGMFISKRDFPDTYNNCFIEIQRIMHSYGDEESEDNQICEFNTLHSQINANNLFVINKKYTNDKIKELLNINCKLKGGINKIDNNTIILIWNSSSPYENKKIGDTIYFIGQNTGTGKQRLIYGNKALYDSFGAKEMTVFLFKDQTYRGKVYVSEEPYYKENKLIFPLKYIT